jgi:hydrogenase maturation protease
MKSVLIGGIGNVLLGDDGIGPYILHQLESQYDFSDEVALADLGTPALDLTHQIVGLRALILIDCVRSNDTPGRIVTYRKKDILSIVPAQRLDPHSPALSECLMTADLLGASPEFVVLVGVVGESYEPGQPLSPAVEQAVEPVIEQILQELDRLGYWHQEKRARQNPDIWWGEVLDLSRFESRE